MNAGRRSPSVLPLSALARAAEQSLQQTADLGMARATPALLFDSATAELRRYAAPSSRSIYILAPKQE